MKENKKKEKKNGNGSKELTFGVAFVADTKNWHKYKLPEEIKVLFSKNHMYLPKDEQVPKRVIIELGTLEDRE